MHHLQILRLRVMFAEVSDIERICSKLASSKGNCKARFLRSTSELADLPVVQLHADGFMCHPSVRC